MSCNCGCERAPATGWRRYTPLLVAALLAAALIAGVLLDKKDDAASAAADTDPARHARSGALSDGALSSDEARKEQVTP